MMDWREYNRRTAAYWIGKRVRSYSRISNQLGSLPAGTVFTIRGKRSGFELEGDPCPSCGLRLRIIGVDPSALDLIEPTGNKLIGEWMMTVERFTKEDFERAFRDARQVDPFAGELVYEVETVHPRVVIRIHSSINMLTGRADGTGQNSIRAYLYQEDKGRSLGKDGTVYTTRVRGWQYRLGEKLAILRTRLRICPHCEGVAVIRQVKKEGPNKGRGFWACENRCWVGWVDEEGW